MFVSQVLRSPKPARAAIAPTQPFADGGNRRPRHDRNEKGRAENVTEASAPSRAVDAHCEADKPWRHPLGVGSRTRRRYRPYDQEQAPCSGHTVMLTIGVRFRRRRLLYQRSTENSLCPNTNPSAWTCFRDTTLPKGVFSSAPPSQSGYHSLPEPRFARERCRAPAPLTITTLRSDDTVEPTGLPRGARVRPDHARQKNLTRIRGSRNSYRYP